MSLSFEVIIINIQDKRALLIFIEDACIEKNFKN